MPFPSGFIDEIRTRLRISEVVAPRVKLTRAGREWKACCPFHSEKSPSFTVNDDKGFYHCFGCGAHGDVVGFVMHFDHLAFPEAVEQLATQAGLKVPASNPEDRERYDHEKRLYDVMDMAAQWFRQCLDQPVGDAARQYLEHRGLTREAMERWRLGYAPNDGRVLLKHMRSKGASDAELLELGLARRREESGELFSFFRDRVIFPVDDRRGRVIAFGARLMEGDGPKYINSPDSPIFHKGEGLFGLARSRVASGAGQSMIVVEGYMDVITLAEAGFIGAVAPLGTALTESQITLLWRLCSPDALTVPGPYLCFDGDAAGERAAMRALDRLLPQLQPDRSALITFLPQGEDPDSLIRRRGPDALRAQLSQSLPISEVLWRTTVQRRSLTTPEARAGLRTELMKRIAAIRDNEVRESYRAEMTVRINHLLLPARRKKDSRHTAHSVGHTMTEAHQRPLPSNPQSQRAKQMLAIMLFHPYIFTEIDEDFAMLSMPEPRLDALHTEMINWLSEATAQENAHETLDAEAFASHLMQRGHAEALAELESSLRAHGWGALQRKSLDEAKDLWVSTFEHYQGHTARKMGAV